MAHGTPDVATQEGSWFGLAARPMKNVLGSPVGVCPPPPEVAVPVLQLAVVPPLLPEQLHFHGPVPVTDDAVPELHRLFVGGAVNTVPFEEPHAPLTAVAVPAVNDVAALFQYTSEAQLAVNTPTIRVYLPAAVPEGTLKLHE